MMTDGLVRVHTGRIEKSRRLLASRGAEQLLISDMSDIRWLSGFTGSSALLLVDVTGAALITDGRYLTQAADEVLGAKVCITDHDLFSEASSFLLKSVVLQSDHLTVAEKERLSGLSPLTSFIDAERLLSELRAGKDEVELACIRKALSISEQTIAECSKRLRPGVTEREVAGEIDFRHAQLGSEGPSFETIVAFGAHSALPHARPGELALRSGDVVLIDCGCTIGGYASDITRTFLYARDNPEVRRVYNVVRAAVERAIASARSGMNAADVDAAGRGLIESAGFGNYFVHSLGHGVGLDIHEWPKISRRSVDVLPENTIITIEPGIYLPDQFGIRIEEMVLLTPDGGKKLNSSSTELIILQHAPE